LTWNARTLGIVALATLLVGVVWMGIPLRRDRSGGGPAAPDRSAMSRSTSINDLLFDLQLLPLEGTTPPAFSLETLDGRRLALADLRGRAALLYFWASW
jgi:hypothetical protein